MSPEEGQAMAAGHPRITLDPKVLVGKPVIRGRVCRSNL